MEIRRGTARSGLGLHVAAGPVGAQEVTLDVLYAQPRFAKYHEPVAQAFMAKHPNIKITFRAPAANYDEGHQTMMRQSITNQLPDIYVPGFHLARGTHERAQQA